MKVGPNDPSPKLIFNTVISRVGGVRKVTTGITGLWQPSVQSDVVFDPSMSALPIIETQSWQMITWVS